MKIKKIEIDKILCISCGLCQSIAPKAFEMKDGKSHPKEDWQDENEKNIISAARSCPVAAISLVDKDGKQINWGLGLKDNIAFLPVLELSIATFFRSSINETERP